MANLDTADLSIREVVERTSIPASTLRMWEVRYGFPEPSRSGGAHRRYSEEDCRLLVAVKRARERGASMAQAIEQGRRALREAQNSIFGGLRIRHPDLPVVLLPEPFMLAISRAIEDTVRDHPHGVLVGSFQQHAAWKVASTRWHGLAADALATVVFAEFSEPARDGDLWRVPARPGTPMAAEWSLVCDTPGWWGCLVGRELPRRRESERRSFEALWSLEPDVVRDAARVAAAVAEPEAPGFAQHISDRLRDRPSAPPASLREATQFTNRIFQDLLRAARASSSARAST